MTLILPFAERSKHASPKNRCGQFYIGIQARSPTPTTTRGGRFPSRQPSTTLRCHYLPVLVVAPCPPGYLMFKFLLLEPCSTSPKKALNVLSAGNNHQQTESCVVGRFHKGSSMAHTYILGELSTLSKSASSSRAHLYRSTLLFSGTFSARADFDFLSMALNHLRHQNARKARCCR